MKETIHLGRFTDGSGYVFNMDNPYGVKYLPYKSYNRYLTLLGGGLTTQDYSQLPDVSNNNEVIGFSEHGLSLVNGEYSFKRKDKPRALTVWFHISNACNLSCKYCYIPKLVKAVDLSKMSSSFMSDDTAQTATDKLFTFCKDKNFTHLQIKFAGGEPTLNPKLIADTCEYALKLSELTGIKIGFRILTNGVFIDDGIYEILRKYKFGVSISIDGDKEKHDEVRFVIAQSQKSEEKNTKTKRKGTWDKIFENIEKLIGIGIKPYILCTITEHNYKHILGLVKACINMNIGFRLSPVRDKTSHLKPGLSEALLKEMVSIYDWIGKNLPVTMPLERFARFAEFNLIVKKQIVCGSCKSTMSIDQNGNVASCQMRIDKPFGNIKESSLEEIHSDIRESEFNRYLVSPELKTGECVSCNWRYTCAGGCPEHTRNAIGTANSPSPWCNLYMNLLPVYIKAIATQIKRAVDLQPA